MNEDRIAQNDFNEGTTIKGASLFFGKDFIAIYAESGGKVGVMDRDAYSILLAPNSPITIVAHHISLALEASHNWSDEKWVTSKGYLGAEERRKAWIADLLSKHPKLKGKKSLLFDGLAWMHVKKKGSIFTLVPKRRIRGDGYGFIVSQGNTLQMIFDSSDDSFSLESALQAGMRSCIA